ncbi:MAG: 30S ribosomal protein S8e [Candidatus Aenigmatarchaeota archaeon]
MLVQGRRSSKPTGGKLNANRKKKKMDIGRDFTPIRIGDERKKMLRKLGGGQKVMLVQQNYANVTDPGTGKTVKSKIITVKENPANPHFVRMNILTKGAVIETEKGLAKVTSRPGQDGVLNAVLVKK